MQRQICTESFPVFAPHKKFIEKRLTLKQALLLGMILEHSLKNESITPFYLKEHSGLSNSDVYATVNALKVKGLVYGDSRAYQNQRGLYYNFDFKPHIE